MYIVRHKYIQFKCLLDYVSLYGQIPGACGLTKSKGKSSAMDVPDSDGFLHQPFILKLALTGANARRLDHELQVYRHLEQAGVSGIPSLLGYRRGSMDGDPRVLMISDAGQPLGNRLDSEQKVELSTEARYASISFSLRIYPNYLAQHRAEVSLDVDSRSRSSTSRCSLLEHNGGRIWTRALHRL